MATDPPETPSVEEAPSAGLLAAPPPPRADADPEPERIAAYVRGAIERDRTPGEVVIVYHPLRTARIPRGLFEALERRGFGVHRVPTAADRVASVQGIRDALLAAHATGRPLDVVAIAGDGTLDHHVLIAAYWAFYPELVTLRDGVIDTSAVGRDDLRGVDASWRKAFLEPLPTGEGLTADEATIQTVWRLRLALERGLGRGASVRALEKAAGRPASDPLMRLAVLSSLRPDKVVLRARGFDLEGLANTSREQTFQGLYPFVRAIAVYPAGTASDNALFAGVPGWGYAQASRWLTRWAWLDGLRRRWERWQVQRFVDYFTKSCATVPARFSLVRFDGAWQAVCSHAVGGPGSGYLFSGDLTSKASGVLGYVLRVPRYVVQEGLFGKTVVHVVVRDVDGNERARTVSQLAEALYTNRTFISGIGSIPSTDPTSFSGRSTWVVAPPIVGRDAQGNRFVQLRGLMALCEAVIKGVLGRALHLVGLGAGTLAGGGRLRSLLPEHQLTLRDGEQIDVQFKDHAGRARLVPTQVSGDPYQATTMSVRVAWGPLPLLAAEKSLLFASVRRGLEQLRIRQTWRLDGVYIGGLYYYRHDVGARWNVAFAERMGLFRPPLYLPPGLKAAQRVLLDKWEALGQGPFVDTSQPGLDLGRRGRYAHSSDHTAHLVVLRQTTTTLLVRQLRASPDGAEIHEGQTVYARFGASYVIRTSQVRLWKRDEDPRILSESHFFRTAEAMMKDAPAFFPFVRQGPDQRTWEEAAGAPASEEDPGRSG